MAHGNTPGANVPIVRRLVNVDKNDYDSGWIQALGYIRNWIRIQHPKPNAAIQQIIDEINEMQDPQWPDQH